jgi:hypothetical protein
MAATPVEPVQIVDEITECNNVHMEVSLKRWGKSLVKAALGLGPSSPMTITAGLGVDGNTSSWKKVTIDVTCYMSDEQRWLGGEEQLMVRILAPLDDIEMQELEQMEQLRAEIDSSDRNSEYRHQKQEELQEKVTQYGELFKIVYSVAGSARVDASLASRQDVQRALFERVEAHALERAHAIENKLPLPLAIEELPPIELVRCGKLQQCTILNHLDGRFSIEFFPDRIGWYNVHIKLNGRPVPETPFDVYFKRPVLNLNSCKVDGIYVDEPVSLQLDLEDPDVQMQQHHLQVRIRKPSGQLVTDAKIEFIRTQQPKHKLSIVVSFVATEAGEYQVDCDAFDRQVAGCPFPVFVTPKLVKLDELTKGITVVSLCLCVSVSLCLCVSMSLVHRYD